MQEASTKYTDTECVTKVLHELNQLRPQDLWQLNVGEIGRKDSYILVRNAFEYAPLKEVKYVKCKSICVSVVKQCMYRNAKVTTPRNTTTHPLKSRKNTYPQKYTNHA